MNGRSWTFLLDRPPLRRAVQHRVGQAVESTCAEAEKALRDAKRQLAAARKQAEELATANSELRRELSLRSENGFPETTSDAFRCTACGTVWLLSTGPDGDRAVHGPIGDACEICTDETPLRLGRIRARRVIAGDPAPAAPDLTTALASTREDDGVVWIASGVPGTPSGG